jgi:thymidylate synthase (FAD)
MPIFVARQLVRHRTQSINEISYRYVQAAREFYVPSPERMQKKAENNKQGSSFEIVDDPELCRITMETVGNICFNGYEGLLAHGLAPELARTVLPVSTYTEWYSQMNLHNFLHMYGLRSDPHAQWEVQQYAAAMISLVEPIFPTIIGSWKKANGKS